jgi:hypothetical protein
VAPPQPGIALVVAHAYNATVSAVNATSVRAETGSQLRRMLFPSLAAVTVEILSACGPSRGRLFSLGDRHAGPAPASDK